MQTQTLIDITELERQRDEFWENGFLILPRFLSPAECARYIDVMDRLDHTITVGARKRSRVPGDGLELRNCVKKAP